MSFTRSIPDPQTMRVGREGYETVGQLTTLHRIHPSAFGSTAFNGTAQGNARFSPIRNARGEIIPTIYAGESFECAVCERILRCPDMIDDPGKPPEPHIVFPSDHADLSYSAIECTRDLKLVDLTGAGQRKLGIAHNVLVAGPKSTYPQTRAWAEAIHRSCPEAQGLFYTSLQWSPQFAVVLFGDRIEPGTLSHVDTRPVKDVTIHERIEELAADLGIDYVDA